MFYEKYFILTVLLLNLLARSIKSQADDYFYDSSIDESKAKEIRENKTRIENELKLSQTTTTEPPPEFFQANEKKNDRFDWNEFYMDKMISEYMKRLQEQQIKNRKAKSDLNHQILSIITLTAFFGITSFIGKTKLIFITLFILKKLIDFLQASHLKHINYV